MNNHPILSLLGLCMRGGRLAVGEEPVEAVARARDARILLVASDAADNTRRRCRHFAEAGDCLWLTLPFTKAELGRAVGRSAAAIVAITDIGLAANVVHRLAELNPDAYTEAAERLDVKAKRAAERKAEQLAHEKNIRQGKRKAKPVQEKPAAAAQKAAPEETPKPHDRPFRRTGTSGTYGRPRRSDGAPFQRSGKGRPSRPNKDARGKSKQRTNPYANSRPVKKGKGSFRKKEQ